jgi:hypothetical protein
MSYITAPTPTPEIGDPFEGGYYVGLIWNQLTYSNSEKKLEIGIHSFTVPDMDAMPIVYIGQQLEIRSKSNPHNKFIGSVVNANKTQLTLNITSINGNGAYNDWAIMALYRIIVSPKEMGEQNGTVLTRMGFNFPIGCQTLNEGWFSTNAMYYAGDQFKYPAAHWARTLIINNYDDWYIPSRDELELCWRYLKPTKNKNISYEKKYLSTYNYSVNGAYTDNSTKHGVNLNSFPIGNGNSSVFPKQTNVAAFKLNGTEQFECKTKWYWTSSESMPQYAWIQSFNNGDQFVSRFGMYHVRVIRRSVI